MSRMKQMAPRRMPSSSPERSLAFGEVQPREAQQNRHHQVVADHRRQRHRLDDHHAGRRRQPADEGEQRQARLMLRHRQGQDEGVGVDETGGEMDQPGERDRQDEQVDQQQVEREQPDRLVEMPLLDVLDDRDLELPRQADDREHRQQRQRHPVADRLHGRQPRDFRHLRGAREQVAEAVEQAEGDEQADAHEGDELDHRLEGDRRHQALMVLGRVDVAGAEQDGEQRHQRRDPQRGVAHHRQHRRRRGFPAQHRVVAAARRSSRRPPSAAARCTA